MGGYFAHHVGCMRPDIRAVAPHSGGTHDLGACIGGHKPIIIFHGDADPVIPVGCDDPTAPIIPLGVTSSATAWAERNGCATSTTTTTVENGTCSYYEGCPSDGQVALCVLHGMGHCWAGGAADAGIYSCPPYANATQLEWQFFKTYAW
jgi:polyhydroxybutyrate depolymerase